MLELPWNCFYWPRMTKDVQLQITRCDQCIHFKCGPQKVAIESIMATLPLQLVHLDYLTIEANEVGKDVYALIIYISFYDVCTGSCNIITEC